MDFTYKYWEDCADPEDMKLMWADPDVNKEWIVAGEKIGQKVHLSRDPDGEVYLTQIEMRAVAEIVVRRHFNSHLNPEMICALAEVASNRLILLENYDKKTKQICIGIMQVVPEIVEWLVREIGYRNYDLEADPNLLYRPFVNVYFGAAYAKWLMSCDGKHRNEEFVVRAYRGGKKKATHKSTVLYFQRYISAKESLPKRLSGKANVDSSADVSVANSQKPVEGEQYLYWESRVSPEDIEEMWRHPNVLEEWEKSGERRGRVRFSLDSEKRPYLSRVEVKAIAEIIMSRYFSSRGLRPAGLAALAEVCSMRFVMGVLSRTGIMGIDYPTALWLYKDVGYRAYKVRSLDDLYNPFVSMYFGAAYLAWLSEYEGRERSPEFIVQAYIGGPENVNLQETGQYWNKFEETLPFYEDSKKSQGQGSCCIL